MTPEELAAKLDALAAENEQLKKTTTELNARFAPPTDPDLQYKPSTWAELKEREEKTAKQIAQDVLKEEREKELAERKRQDDAVAEQSKKIDETFAKLQEDGIIEETKDQNDRGALQRRQILASLVRSGGQHVDVEARKLKSLWDAGLEYDDTSNSFKPTGRTASPNREQFVGSSTQRVVAPSAKGGVINPKDVRSLDDAEALWLAKNK